MARAADLVANKKKVDDLVTRGAFTRSPAMTPIHGVQVTVWTGGETDPELEAKKTAVKSLLNVLCGPNGFATKPASVILYCFAKITGMATMGYAFKDSLTSATKFAIFVGPEMVKYAAPVADQSIFPAKMRSRGGANSMGQNTRNVGDHVYSYYARQGEVTAKTKMIYAKLAHEFGHLYHQLLAEDATSRSATRSRPRTRWSPRSRWTGSPSTSESGKLRGRASAPTPGSRAWAGLRPPASPSSWPRSSPGSCAGSRTPTR